MALRIANKINRQFFKNVCRSLSTKRDVPDLEVTSRGDDALTESANSAGPSSQVPPSSAQYQVPQSRPSRSGAVMAVSGLQTRSSVQNESDVAKNAMAMQHLQPALLPEYFKPPVEINSSIYQEPVNEAEKQSSIKKARRFEESSTRLNLTLPLKARKLANPFPEPVKVMESHTVSDREKAELMLTEQKMAARTAPASPPPPPRTPSPARHRRDVAVAAGQRRYYSTQGKKCKVGQDHETHGRKKLRRFRMSHCQPPWTGGCDKVPRETICKKKLAPYPSYSEFCVTVPYRKPSECRTCPYKESEHPTFHPSKKRFHTSSPLKDKVKLPDDWLTKAAQPADQPSTSGYKAPAKTKAATVECLKDKGPCKRPPNQCDNHAKDAEKDKKYKKEHCKDEKKPTPRKASDVTLGDQIGAWLHQVARKKTPLVEAAEAQKILAAYAEDAHKRKPESVIICKDKESRCRKFPFRESTFPLVKHRKPRPPPMKHGECPKKPSPKLIKDCPPEPKDERCSSSQMAAPQGGAPSGPASPSGSGGFGYLMTDKGDKEKKPVCKKWQFPKCNEGENLPKDKCDDGLHPKTAYCPRDVGRQLGYTRPKFVPKTQQEMDDSRKKKKTKGAAAAVALPIVAAPLTNAALQGYAPATTAAAMWWP